MPVTVRVLSYNVHMQQDDLDALAAVVHEVAPDVVCVQEAPRKFRWRHRCSELARRLGLVYAAGGLPSMGNLILTNLRVRVHDTWCGRLPFTPGRHMRGAAFARCSVGKVPFVVAGSHLSVDPAERPRQGRALKELLGKISEPVILGADVNDTPGSDCWRILADGLVDVAAATGNAHRHTFPAAGPNERIDVLFADPRFEVVRYDVIETDQARRASDHLPILADLALAA